MIIRSVLFCSLLVLIGCQDQGKDANIDDINSIKKDFISSILQEEVNESPFHINYELRTVFFSKELVSLFGEIHVYERLPHAQTRYEARTFFKIHGKFREITLGDLFPTSTQKEFLQKYCEEDLKIQAVSYFSGVNPVHTKLNQEDVSKFVLGDKFLIIFFQPYTVGGLNDGVFHVRIPYEILKKECSSSNLLLSLINKISSSENYTYFWDY